MIVRQLTPEERFEAGNVMSVAFHYKRGNLEKEREEALKNTTEHWGAFAEDGALMGCAINNRFRCFLDGTPVETCGIGGVATLPEYRASGAIRGVFEALIPYAYQNGEVLSALYPFRHAFYRKFGYETVCCLYYYDFAPLCLKRYRAEGDIRLWREGESVSAFTDIYNAFAKKYMLAELRNDEMTKRHINGDYRTTQTYRYLLQDAYVAYSADRDTLRVTDCAWSSVKGFYNLLGFLGRFTADYAKISLVLPEDIELHHFVDDPFAVPKTAVQKYMVRIINAEKALSAIKKPRGVRFALRVSDPYIEKNNNTFLVEDGAVSIADVPCDMELSVGALSQLLAGAVNLEGLLYRSDVTLYGNKDALSETFVRKAAFIGYRY
ncbi:MAG: GNAT family N-acetyltransferase [Christensenellales bacterium]|jgi:predicted acetyltransferase